MPRAVTLPLITSLLLYGSVASAGERLAVLELSGELDVKERGVLTDEVRGAAVKALPSDVAVMTRENMEVMLTDMGLDADCVAEGACEVETARNLGVDYVISGDVVMMGETLVASLKLHETRSGQLLSSERARGGDSLALMDELAQTTTELMTPLSADKSTPNNPVTSTPSVSIPTAIVAEAAVVYDYEMVSVSAGSFTMGSDDGARDAKPAHSVSVSGFWLGKTEVTQGLYQQVMGKNPSTFSACGGECPVEQVSWLEAAAFANALSEKEGLEVCYSISGSSVSWPKGLDCVGYRLPTEAEWEYAAKAGEAHTYSGSNELSSVGWYYENSSDKTHPVAQKQPNAWGLYDMSGNVYEWTWDWYDKKYYQDSPSTDPVGPSSGSERVRRGSSWGLGDPVATRDGVTPSIRGSSFGFRLARTAD